MIASSQFLTHVLTKLEPIGRIAIKRMFGGIGLYYREVIFGIIAFDELYFRTDKKSLQAFQNAGSSPLVFPGRQSPGSMQYWKVPGYVLEDAALLERWVKRSYQISLEKKRA